MTPIINSDIVDVWKDPIFLGTKVNPLIHRLLLLEASHAGDGYHLEEALRTAAILYLATIRVKVMSIHVVGRHYLTRLKALFIESDNDANWSSFQDLKLWILVLVTMNASGANQSYFLELMLRNFETLGLASWDDAICTVTGLLWPIDMFSSRSLILGRLVTARRLEHEGFI